MLKKSKFAEFKVAVKTLWGLATWEKATLKSEILELGFQNNLAQHAECSHFLQFMFLNEFIAPKLEI